MSMTAFALACVATLMILSTQVGTAASLEVAPGTAFETLAAALAAAESGDTIYIASPVLNERNLQVNKRVNIVGIDRPRLDIGGKGQGLVISADSVLVRGLEVAHSGVSYLDDNAAILIEGAANCIVENCLLTDNFFAIYLAEAASCQIRNNVIAGAATSEGSSGNAIHLWYCRDIEVSNNEVRGHRDGIYFEFVRSSRIHDNLSEHNLRYGLHFMYSDSCDYADNLLRANGAGVAVMYSRHVLMRDNRFEENWGAAAYGLLLKEIFDSEVINNRFWRNSTGIHAEGSNRVVVDSNDLIDNGWAVKVMANCSDNAFTNNNFIENTFQVATNSRQNFSKFDRNFWSNYDGYDLDRDGTGDVPFRPVSLFALVVERQPVTLLLLRSLLVDVLDLIERLLPSVTPETLVDKHPRLRPVG